MTNEHNDRPNRTGTSRRRFMKVGAVSGLAIGGLPGVAAARRPEASNLVRLQGTHDDPVSPQEVFQAIQTAKKDYLKRDGKPWSDPTDVRGPEPLVGDNPIVDASVQIGPNGAIYGSTTRMSEETPLNYVRDVQERKLDHLHEAMYEPDDEDDVGTQSSRSHISTWSNDEADYPYGRVQGTVEWYYQRSDSGYYYYDFGPSKTFVYPGYQEWDTGWRGDLGWQKHYYDGDYSTMYSYPTDHDPTGTDQSGSISVSLSKSPSLSYSFSVYESSVNDLSSLYQKDWQLDITNAGGTYTQSHEPASRYRINAGDEGKAGTTYAQARFQKDFYMQYSDVYTIGVSWWH